MKTTYFKNMILIVLFAILISCKNDKAETNITKEATEVSSVKKNKGDKTKKNTIIKVDATINNKKINIDAIDPKYNSVVVLLNDAIQFKYTDFNNQVVLVNIFDEKIHHTIPNTFSQQVSALPFKEQMTSKEKRSRLEIVIPSKPVKQGDAIVFYQGDVILKEYTDKKIIINFKGEGFPVGSNIKKDKLFPMEGSIVIEDYNIYDGRL